MQKTTSIFSAWLLDGVHQMAGELVLDQEQIIFRPTQFKSGNLNISIPYTSIITMEEFLLFDLTRNGLRVVTYAGSVDSFILEDSKLVYGLLKKRINQ